MFRHRRFGRRRFGRRRFGRRKFGFRRRRRGLRIPIGYRMG